MGEKLKEGPVKKPKRDWSKSQVATGEKVKERLVKVLKEKLFIIILCLERNGYKNERISYYNDAKRSSYNTG